MPDNQARIKFNGAYMARVDRAVYTAENLLRAIQPKLRAGRVVEKNRAVSGLWMIKQYAYVNTKSIPFSDEYSVIKHDEVSLVKIRNAKQSLKVLYETLMPAKQKAYKQNYAAALDLFNRFEVVLTAIIMAQE